MVNSKPVSMPSDRVQASSERVRRMSATSIGTSPGGISRAPRLISSGAPRIRPMVDPTLCHCDGNASADVEPSRSVAFGEGDEVRCNVGDMDVVAELFSACAVSGETSQETSCDVCRELIGRFACNVRNEHRAHAASTPGWSAARETTRCTGFLAGAVPCWRRTGNRGS